MTQPRDKEFDELSYLRNEVKRLRTALGKLTPGIEMVLRRRGLQVFKKEPADDLLVPEAHFFPDYYRLMHKYSFRLFLRDIIKNQDFFTLKEVTRYATLDVTRGYVKALGKMRMIREKGYGFELVKRPITSFGPTLEWYVAEVLKDEFGAEVLRGVKFKGASGGGDYDVIARIDGSLLLVEVKSSPPKQIYPGEISAFLDRITALSPEVAVFFMDTELRMKDKVVALFEEELARRSASPRPVKRMEREIFEVQDRIFIVNAKENIVSNIEKVLCRYYQTKPEMAQAESA